MRHRAHHQIPGIEAARRLVLRAKTFGGIEMRLDRGNDRLGDLVLHGEDVGDVAVVALGPQMAAGGDIVELRGNAHLVAAPAHAAFDDVAHAEIMRDLVDVDRAALVDKRRVARDDEEPPQLGQRGDDVLADAVGEILLGAVAAHVDEGQHGDAGPVAQQQRRLRFVVAMRAQPVLPAPQLPCRSARRRRSGIPCAQWCGSASARCRCRQPPCARH